jgi:hypothetical protein
LPVFEASATPLYAKITGPSNGSSHLVRRVSRAAPRDSDAFFVNEVDAQECRSRSTAADGQLGPFLYQAGEAPISINVAR